MWAINLRAAWPGPACLTYRRGHFSTGVWSSFGFELDRRELRRACATLEHRNRGSRFELKNLVHEERSAEASILAFIVLAQQPDIKVAALQPINPCLPPFPGSKYTDARVLGGQLHVGRCPTKTAKRKRLKRGT